ncbi:unnamed protein product [Rotaria magnacalcarata]|uniref:Uncharacterized protein n=1 Tax=Rotaria magnacalcarata TaxID=392030 RepID=A0A816YG38_9BILA|nr:unnamed protein product [Rotaria magnacalcarata]CAF2159042.1 unnamed protein product [Rotaria magnacalcarata]CAF3877050.1 unnamed protein product [Rotaria magnacalcarata]CAF3935427.1 unnamed protein product [Rotaria magnacalcarata]
MISLTIWLLLWSTFFVLAPPLLNTHNSRSHGNLTLISSNLLTNNSVILMKQHKTKTNRNGTQINSHYFNVEAYRSSWTFVDKNTIRVYFRLSESLLESIVSTSFLVRHTRTDQIRTFDGQSEIINSTLTVYLHNIRHGRHTVCLLLYTSKFMENPNHIFCQDVIFNFQKYGHHDINSDEYGNTFVFLLTQYGIVIGMLCILQLIHAARKRCFLRRVYEKVNTIRNYMLENHHRLTETKPTTDLTTQSSTLEYLIYNLSRSALYNYDELHTQPTMENNTNIINQSSVTNRHRTENNKNFKSPYILEEHSIKPSFEQQRSKAPIVNINDDLDFNDDMFDENEFDTSAYEEQLRSFQSVSHILEENKPWIARIADDGTIQHSILNSKPV